MISSTRRDCPWDTIAMIPTVKAEGKATSLECWQDESALIYDSIDQLDERVRKPLTAGAKNSPQPEAA